MRVYQSHDHSQLKIWGTRSFLRILCHWFFNRLNLGQGSKKRFIFKKFVFTLLLTILKNSFAWFSTFSIFFSRRFQITKMAQNFPGGANLRYSSIYFFPKRMGIEKFGNSLFSIWLENKSNSLKLFSLFIFTKTTFKSLEPLSELVQFFHL